MVSVVAFDHRLNCIDDTKRDAEIDHFVKSVDGFMEQLGILMFSLPTWQYFPNKDWKKFVYHTDNMYKYLKPFLKFFI